MLVKLSVNFATPGAVDAEIDGDRSWLILFMNCLLVIINLSNDKRPAMVKNLWSVYGVRGVSIVPVRSLDNSGFHNGSIPQPPDRRGDE
jgi:hypothetical protein